MFFFQPQSDLYGLIQVMIVVFGEEPPVFSRPTTQAPYQPFQAAGPPNREWHTVDFCCIIQMFSLGFQAFTQYTLCQHLHSTHTTPLETETTAVAQISFLNGHSLQRGAQASSGYFVA